MKTKFTIQNGFGRELKRAVAFWALLVSAGFAAVAQAAPPSPVGTWDISFTGGGRVGLANITFADDFTFDGFEIIAPRSAANGSQANGRDDGSGGSRVPGSGTTPLGTNIFGFEHIGGQWGLDSKGRVIGSWVELAAADFCITNTTVTTITETNGNTVTTTYSTNTVVNCNALTNQVSFVGKVVAGKRLTLVASTSTGTVNYRGVPYAGLADVSGSWYGFKSEQQQTFLEFFTLTADGPNTYDFVGSGPGGEYTYEGFAMVSAQKKMAFASRVAYPTVVTNTFSAVGPFNPKKAAARTRGIEVMPSTSFPLIFNATRSGP